MSVFRPVALVCPTCRTENVETVAVSLHGPRVPEVLAAIAAGTFQCFTCHGCGLEYRADGPLLYVDFERRRWIGVFPQDLETRWAVLEHQPLDSFPRSMIDLAPDFLRHEAGGFTIRSVFGLPALAEKIRLLDAGHDDRVVEAAKLAVALRAGAVLAPDRRPIVLDAAPDALDLLLWLPPPGDGPPAEAVVHLAAADLVDLAGDPSWHGVVAELDLGPFVDLGRLLLDGRAPLPP